MENRAVTFPQTKTILEGVNVPNVQLDDIQAILYILIPFLFGKKGALLRCETVFIIVMLHMVSSLFIIAWLSGN